MASSSADHYHSSPSVINSSLNYHHCTSAARHRHIQQLLISTLFCQPINTILLLLQPIIIIILCHQIINATPLEQFINRNETANHYPIILSDPINLSEFIGSIPIHSDNFPIINFPVVGVLKIKERSSSFQERRYISESGVIPFF